MTRNYATVLALVVILALSVALKVYTDHSANKTREIAADVAMKLYRAQIRSCERGNIVRAESNRRAISHERDRKAFILVWSATEKARTAEWRATGSRYAKAVAVAARRGLKLERSFRFREVPLVICTDVIEKP